MMLIMDGHIFTALTVNDNDGIWKITHELIAQLLIATNLII